MDALNELDKKVLSLCRENKKIHAIQLVVQTTKWTLAKSKKYVEDLISYSTLEEQENSQDIDELIITLCKTGKKIEAIKLVCEELNLGLKESKDYVDRLMDKQK